MNEQKICGYPRCDEKFVGRGKRCHKCRNSVQRYGMTSPEREDLLTEQGRQCLLCSSTIGFNSGPRNNSSAVIDHCHATGDIRGILCHKCNSFLGYVETSSIDLDKVKQYLER